MLLGFLGSAAAVFQRKQLYERGKISTEIKPTSKKASELAECETEAFLVPSVL